MHYHWPWFGNDIYKNKNCISSKGYVYTLDARDEMPKSWSYVASIQRDDFEVSQWVMVLLDDGDIQIYTINYCRLRFSEVLLGSSNCQCMFTGISRKQLSTRNSLSVNSWHLRLRLRARMSFVLRLWRIASVLFALSSTEITSEHYYRTVRFMFGLYITLVFVAKLQAEV